jgi:uncharacterized LabA/DUF88 family protein
MRHFERSAIYIDGANLRLAVGCLGIDLDYARLLRLLRGKARSTQAFYYAALTEEQANGRVDRLTDWLGHNGYVVVTKQISETIDAFGRRKFKGSIDVDLAVDALAMAARVDTLTLVSGNGAFRSLIHAVQRRGVRVSVVSTIRTRPPIIAEELRRQADEFIDIGDVADEIRRTPVASVG